MRISFLCRRMMVLFYVFLACIVLQTVFAVWMLWAAGGTKFSSATIEGPMPAVSVIICAKNEAENLKKNLPLICDQQYPVFEVIVVNDASDDETQTVLKELQLQFAMLNIISIHKDEPRTLPGKKFALSKGVAAAQHENLLLCDADCQPASLNWIALMTAPLNGQKEIVAGYGAYRRAKSFLNIFIRWETLHTFIQYSTYAKTGIPYMAVGRNLACRKSLLQSAQKTGLWASMPSGDDDLLIRLEGNNRNVAIVADLQSFTFSEAKPTFASWIHQKQRHVSTGKLYRKPVQFLLSLYGLSHGLMWLLWLVLWISGYGYLISSLMILRCFLIWCLWAIQAEAMNDAKLIFCLPICDIGWAFYNLFLSPYLFFKTKAQWK